MIDRDWIPASSCVGLVLAGLHALQYQQLSWLQYTQSTGSCMESGTERHGINHTADVCYVKAASMFRRRMRVSPDSLTLQSAREAVHGGACRMRGKSDLGAAANTRASSSVAEIVPQQAASAPGKMRCKVSCII